MDPSIAGLMNAVEDGEASAADSVFSALYAELHRLAKPELARPGAAVNLSPTILLREAYLDISGSLGNFVSRQSSVLGIRSPRDAWFDHRPCT